MRASTQTKRPTPISTWIRRAAIAAACVSMGFTAYFGWVTGGDDTFAKWFNAAGGALISGAVPTFFFLSAVATYRGAQTAARSFFVLGFMFGFLDAASNTGALFSMREGSRLTATHATNVAGDIRKRMSDLQKREATLMGKTASVKVWQDSGSIVREITDLEAKRTRESKRGGCGPECEKIDDRLLKRRQDLAIAKGVEKANSDLVSVRKQLAGLRTESKTSKGKVSPIDTISLKMGSIFTWVTEGSLNPSKDFKEFIYLLITAVLGTGLTVLSGGLGYGATWLKGGEAYEEENYAEQAWIEPPAGHHPQPVPPRPAAQPYPLHAQPAPPPPSRAAQANPNADWNNGLDALDRVLARAEARRAASA